ncbi:DUF1444 family protein [Emticicia sp. ODNR4P]|nr:DUF1444 family protein [Emticicia sp. ODNR4P]
MGIFDQFFKKNQNTESNQEPSAFDIPISELQKAREGTINLGQSIFPVIKRADDPKVNINSISAGEILKDPIAEEIVVCYVIDMGENFEFITTKHLLSFGLTFDDIRDAGRRNLINRVNEDCKISIMDYSSSNPAIKPFYRLEFDSNLNPSIMLLDEFWESSIKEIIDIDTIAVTIPAKNIIFFSDMKVMESFRTMRPISKKFYEASILDKVELSTNTYIRKNGKWILFLDTDEQMAELW